ncbi:MAG: bifunctional [glutamate--ammonia ligase]-adenylyl-L-tyrosine phosphorylase/[glutamate--ammonia-ligase] adenylyltransferase [Gammaproteobacteria bacterium]|nr:bifunctional [glutamate--ammonia ligase]-adenylyl-L-tyrosine phosphorylase/[glutamate--ammonia-ligase] adenylyltransferase [Gammaproteobacteria bacterium]MBU1625378.1 bifunctional [glutamate--ammonia ligase]-adenylyl-L-tyrosine phosphorylase/[glutamate--ammonia-ligase] adenylyltransferase [Gammaproteobacteria bacterium]MBU1981638.1 bifunctional [glutamate--ammonia ligase]-adenylyl-L-tyrosine phosphorylase/[glutamate--ammonia-ligase] adenylyltransferase [Gammaproteobacteria bacterium]
MRNPQASNDFDQLVQHAAQCSRYFSRLVEAEPDWLDTLRRDHRLPADADLIRRWLDELPADDEAQLSRALRMLRKRVMLHLILRDLGGLCGLEEVVSAMTALAELAVQRAQALMMATLGTQFGQPIGADSGEPQQMLVIGMGKLGGGELNVSSDIDLIFVYPEEGETNGARTLSNHEFFSRLGRKVIALVNDLTADGYVFRVDMRLRPYGDSGPLAMSFAALEEYLVAQGREWERYAWIKARVISPLGDPNIDELEKLAQPFVFRKYLDFGAFDSMRKLHAQIRAEVVRRDRQDNIKLGSGGIREIEFIAQVFQLIRGGRDARLRIKPTRQVLQLLAQEGELQADVVQKLDESYAFLRNLEHRLQYLDDQQTQMLPEGEEQRSIIARGMGYADYAALLAELDPLREFVSSQFEAVFGSKQAASDSSIWHENGDHDELTKQLSHAGYSEAAELADILLQMRASGRYRQLPEISRERMDSLIPRFIKLCATEPKPDATLRRALNLLEAIARRAAYLAFLAEYPQALPRLMRILSASAWAGDYLAQHPILLDELLDARELYEAPDWKALDAQLLEQLEAHLGDTEREMDVLRQFRQVQTFHLLAMDLHGVLSLENLSDHLSDLADLILRHVLRLCWRDARKKHIEQPKFAVIAYGKLGGKELGYSSDLDLVFLFEDDDPDAGQIYARLGQRINTLISSYTAAGRLYEVDLRLRPNGDSGLLVSSTEAFESYQRENAWMWEHQALTRARFCAGDPAVGERFEQIRKSILCMPRDTEKLRAEVREMRQKMHDGHPNPTELFDIKHDSGGMVDIEFMVQFIVLAYASRYPQLTMNVGNLALLQTAAELKLIDQDVSTALQAHYRELRKLQHQMRLNKTAARIEPGRLDTSVVKTLWETLFEQ